jgi:hypothetical protein
MDRVMYLDMYIKQEGTEGGPRGGMGWTLESGEGCQCLTAGGAYLISMLVTLFE